MKYVNRWSPDGQCEGSTQELIIAVTTSRNNVSRIDFINHKLEMIPKGKQPAPIDRLVVLQVALGSTQKESLSILGNIRSDLLISSCST